MSDAADSSVWTRVGKHNQPSTDPQLTVYSHGQGYINAAADERLLETPPGVHLLIDQDTNRVALQPSAGPEARSITRDSDRGGEVHLKSGLKYLDVDVAELEETHFFELELEDGLAVADLTSLVDGSDEGADGDDGEADTDEQLTCDEAGCDYTTDSERGLAIHKARSHESDDDDTGDDCDGGETNDTGSDDESSDAQAETGGVSLATVRDCAEEVETVQELADLLDVDVGQARAQARDAGVYSELRDKVARPGVDR